FVESAWPVLERLGLRPDASPDRLRFAGSLAEAAGGAGFVQESAPEALDVKIALLAELDAATPPDVVIRSSTSGLMMSDLAARGAGAGRGGGGPPFHPAVSSPAGGDRRRTRHRSSGRDVGRGVLHPQRQGLPDDGQGGARLRREPAPRGAVA